MDHYDTARRRSKARRRSVEAFETGSSSSHGSDDLQPLGSLHRSSKHRRRSDIVTQNIPADSTIGMSLLADFGPETSRESFRHRHHKHKHRRRSDRPSSYPEQYPDLLRQVPTESTGHRSRSSQGSIGSDCSNDSQSNSRSREKAKEELADLYLNTKASMVRLPYNFTLFIIYFWLRHITIDRTA